MVTPVPHRSRARALGAGVAARLPILLVGVVAFGAARVAMLPGLAFWDTGELQAVGPVLGTAHPTGYPSYAILGWVANLVLAPFGEPAFRMNLFAGLCVAVAAAVTADLVRTLTRSLTLGVLAGIGFALTEVVWELGTHAEAHALHLALLAILFRLLVAWGERVERGEERTDRWLVAATVAFGVSVGNHSLTLLLAPAVGLYVLNVQPAILRQPRTIALYAGALVVTVVAIFLELPLRAGPFPAPLVYAHPETWDGFWYVVLAEQFRDAVASPLADLPRTVALLVDRTVGTFGPLTPALPVAFVATAFHRPRYAILSGVAMGVTLVFATSYTNGDIDRYYAGPVLIAWTWLAILAAVVAAWVGSMLEPADDGSAHDRPADTTGSRLERPPHPLVALGLTIALLAPTATALPTRLEQVDRSHDTAARRWVDGVLRIMEPNATIVSWWSYSTPLWYAQRVEGRRPDITIIDDRTRLDLHLGELNDVIDAYLPRGAVYVIRIEPDEIRDLPQRYVLELIGGPDAGSLTRIVSLRQAGA